jgi:acyl dehydratase
MDFAVTSALPTPGEAASSHFLEDFHLGMTLRSDEWIATADDFLVFGQVSRDLHPMHVDPGFTAIGEYDGVVGQGPLGLARYFGTLHDSGIVVDTVIGLLDTHWHYLQPVTPDTKMHYETTVLSVRRSSAGDRGVVDRHVKLLDEDGRCLQWGTTAFLVRARGEAAADEIVSQPITVRWGRALADLLAEDSEFCSSTMLFDGSIALADDRQVIQFRIYRGRILEVTSRTPAGPTFTVHGSGLAWAGVLTSARNDFVVRTHRGEFSTSGNAYVYLQMTKPLYRIVEVARTMTAREITR